MAPIDFGPRMKELLRVRGLSQIALADAIGTTGATMSRIVAGKAGLTVRMAHKIAAQTGVRSAWLLTGELPMMEGQDLSAVARESYLSGWRDAIASIEQRLKELGTLVPGLSPEISRRGSLSALGAAKQHRLELEARGLARPQGAPPRPRRKRA